MSKVTHIEHYGDNIYSMSCGHQLTHFNIDPPAKIGDEVSCPTCAERAIMHDEILSLKGKLQRAEGKIAGMIEFQKKHMSMDLSKGDKLCPNL